MGAVAVARRPDAGLASLFLLLLACGTVQGAHFVLASAAQGNIRTLSAAENALLKVECGRSAPPAARTWRMMIGAGRPARPHQFPWAAAISDDQIQTCGATLISSRHLITAAHCFFTYNDVTLPCKGARQKNVDDMSIRLGGVCLKPGKGCDDALSKHFAVRQVATLHGFNEQGCDQGDDLAIVELDEDVEFTDAIRPVCLPPPMPGGSAQLNTMVDQLHSAGFGKDEDHSTVAKLYYFFTNLLSVLLPDIVSAQSADKRSRICPGDSGGGLVGRLKKTGRFAIVGVHSYAQDCLLEKENLVYMNTLISRHLRELCKLTGICGNREESDVVESEEDMKNAVDEEK